VEPVRRRRFSGLKAPQAQIEPDLDGLTSELLQHAPAEAPVLSQGMSRTDDPPVVEEDVEPVDEVQVQEAASATARPRKPRRQASAIAEQVVASGPVSEPALAPVTEVVEPSPVVTPRKLSHHGLPRRQAAAGRLPRHERWKRRLHPACW
jgi:hypothetical protein